MQKAKTLAAQKTQVSQEDLHQKRTLASPMMQAKPDPAKRNHRNDVRPLKHVKQLEKLDLDLDSPRLKLAIKNLGVSPAELKLRTKEFFLQKPQDDEDVVKIRYKHHQNGLLALVNRLLDEREEIKKH